MISEKIEELVNVLEEGMKKLGNNNALTDMGAIEAHGLAIINAAKIMAKSIDNLSYVIERLKS
jgi:hypothetical protein